MGSTVKLANDLYLETSSIVRKQGSQITPLDTYLDTIVESGSNSNGEYTKYTDGTMICTKRVIKQNVKLTNSWYSLFNNENYTSIDLGSYAATFIEEPVVSITYMGGNGCWLINNNGHSASSPGKVQLCTVSSRAIGTCILDIIAIGRWK